MNHSVSDEDVQGWQPIETAPIPLFDPDKWYLKTLRVLVYHPKFVEIATYSYTERGKGRWQSEMLHHNIKPTHWMPLPAPPAGKGE